MPMPSKAVEKYAKKKGYRGSSDYRQRLEYRKQQRMLNKRTVVTRKPRPSWTYGLTTFWIKPQGPKAGGYQGKYGGLSAFTFFIFFFAEMLWVISLIFTILIPTAHDFDVFCVITLIAIVAEIIYKYTHEEVQFMNSEF